MKILNSFKHFNLMLIVVIGLIANVGEAQDDNGDSLPTSEELSTTCLVLQLMTAEAIENNKKNLLTLYYNTYMALNGSNTLDIDCVDFFTAIYENYGDSFGGWLINNAYPPQMNIGIPGGRFEISLPPTTPGGFTNNEVELFRKFQKFNFSEETLDQAILLKSLDQKDQLIFEKLVTPYQKKEGLKEGGR